MCYPMIPSQILEQTKKRVYSPVIYCCAINLSVKDIYTSSIKGCLAAFRGQPFDILGGGLSFFDLARMFLFSGRATILFLGRNQKFTIFRAKSFFTFDIHDQISFPVKGCYSPPPQKYQMVCPLDWWLIEDFPTSPFSYFLLFTFSLLENV